MTEREKLIEVMAGCLGGTHSIAASRAVVRDQIAALCAAGYRIVPEEPTDKQRRAATDAVNVHVPYATIYRAMLAAAEEG